MGRRRFLMAGAAAVGALATRGLPGAGFFDRSALGFDESLRALGRSLTQRQRDLVVFAEDHPSRQILNAQTVLDRPHLGTLFSPEQRVLIEDLYASMVSPRGFESLAPTIAVEGRFDGCVLAIYGDPVSPGAHVVFQGGHVMLRGGGSPHGAAFGGGVSYGHQVGDHQWRLPGNSFAHHADQANRLFASLTPAQRGVAIVAQPPHELVVQVQDAAGRFDGVRIGGLGDAARQATRSLLDAVFATYPSEAVSEAYSCIEANGGIDALHFAVYASHGFYEDMQPFGSLSPGERSRRGDPFWQVWRLEGPGTIVHFQGYPHVHAYVQIVRDPRRANLGTELAVAERTLEGPAVSRVMRAALRRASGESLAFVADSVPGRICAGPVTSGLAYALDPYRNFVVVALTRGDRMGAELRAQLEGDGTAIEPSRTYRVATIDYYAEQAELFGSGAEVEAMGLPLRQALTEHLRVDGLRAVA